MSDVLTQIQDEVDKLLLQMQSSLQTIKHRAPPSAPPGQPLLTSFTVHAQQQAQQAQAQAAANAPQQGQGVPAQSHDALNASIPEVSPEELQNQIKELSHDLVQKEQQIETLIKALPGHGVSEKEQWEKMKALKKELLGLEQEKEEAVKDREELLRKVERLILGVGAV
ncbi:uncharacterized protein EI97DRAFT_430255 [Westerdykella ornata]|uniref:Mediator of RNA polymerase II transcription subunit 21 n=1 Tax=Westerdykella ornata TaxID=318751 RepID=A0A6A6JTI5_WESOR|nr:uncharacterized protein EI97DRAFT_430255 [Westerdykella ornata]KAF2279158.1 hypothetical protein EI97DRAFT_430255 [Westerdykella ornata]